MRRRAWSRPARGAPAARPADPIVRPSSSTTVGEPSPRQSMWRTSSVDLRGSRPVPETVRDPRGSAATGRARRRSSGRARATRVPLRGASRKVCNRATALLPEGARADRAASCRAQGRARDAVSGCAGLERERGRLAAGVPRRPVFVRARCGGACSLAAIRGSARRRRDRAPSSRGALSGAAWRPPARRPGTPRRSVRDPGLRAGRWNRAARRPHLRVATSAGAGHVRDAVGPRLVKSSITESLCTILIAAGQGRRGPLAATGCSMQKAR